MHDRRTFPLSAGSAGMTLKTFGWKSPALAQSTTPARAATTTSLLLRRAGEFFSPGDL